MPRLVWDEEMVARAAGMKRAGFSNKVIAERLGVTEKAVQGRMHRAKHVSGWMGEAALIMAEATSTPDA